MTEPSNRFPSSYHYLDDDHSCSRDIPFLQKLRTNVVRTCCIDPSHNHSGCMNELANAGIYVLIDLMAPGFTISTTNPVWNGVLYDQYTSVVDAMHSYSNLLGFVIADGVAFDTGSNASAPYVKAAVRDVKAHIRRKNYRPIPVGYVGYVVSSYLNCGNQSDSIDFWGVTMPINFPMSDNDARFLPFNYSVPMFIAAYGWLPSTVDLTKAVFVSHPFSDIPILFGAMSSVWSGGLIYQFMGGLGSEGYGKHTRLFIVAIS